MTLLILVATARDGSEIQVIISEDDFKNEGGKAADFFVPSAKNAKIAGRLKCTGDTEWISGAYLKEQ